MSDTSEAEIRADERRRIHDTIKGYAAGRSTVQVSDMLVMCGLTPTLIAAALLDGGDWIAEGYRGAWRSTIAESGSVVQQNDQ